MKHIRIHDLSNPSEQFADVLSDEGLPTQDLDQIQRAELSKGPKPLVGREIGMFLDLPAPTPRVLQVASEGHDEMSRMGSWNPLRPNSAERRTGRDVSPGSTSPNS